MKLGNLQLKSNLFLAPMAGITDFPFRTLAREKGCGLAFTEMVSAEGLLRKGPALAGLGRGEHPVSVQLFGAHPDILAEAAEMAEGMGADAIDINMGCPAEQVVRRGAGAGLMRSPEKVEQILTSVRNRLKVPLTVKIRSGWDGGRINALEISKIAEACGTDGIFLHPRTKDQSFRGRADWNLIREVKSQVRIPLIGNGDVKTVFLVRRMLEETGCDGVMIGRGSLGNPWIFSLLRGQDPTPSLEEREGTILRHFFLLQEYYGEKEAVKKIRRHVAWCSRGLPFSASFRGALAGLKGKESLLSAIRAYFESVKEKQCRSCGSTENGFITGREETIL